MAQAAGDLHDVDVVDLVRAPVQVLNLARQVDQLLGKLPGAENLVAQGGLNLLDHVMQADRIR
ncbi:hypothetical protein D3C76_1821580 [compost metagenome]